MYRDSSSDGCFFDPWKASVAQSFRMSAWGIGLWSSGL